MMIKTRYTPKLRSVYWCFFVPTVQGGDTLYQKNWRKDKEHWALVFCLSDGSNLFMPYTQLKADAFGKYTEELEV